MKLSFAASVIAVIAIVAVASAETIPLNGDLFTGLSPSRDHKRKPEQLWSGSASLEYSQQQSDSTSDHFNLSGTLNYSPEGGRG